jgi:hypothetical protein
MFGTCFQRVGRQEPVEQAQDLLVEGGHVLFGFGLHQHAAQDASARDVGLDLVTAGGQAGGLGG